MYPNHDVTGTDVGLNQHYLDDRISWPSIIEDGHLSDAGWNEISRTLDWIQAEVAALAKGFATISKEK